MFGRCEVPGLSGALLRWFGPPIGRGLMPGLLLSCLIGDSVGRLGCGRPTSSCLGIERCGGRLALVGG